MIDVNKKKYIHIFKFVELEKTLKPSDFMTYISFNLLADSKDYVIKDEVYSLLNFYSPRQIKNSIAYLKENNYITSHDDKKYIIKYRFKDLCEERNNFMAINLNDFITYKKYTLQYYKMQILKYFGSDLLIKQDTLHEILNISRHDIRVMKNEFKMKVRHQYLDVKGYVKNRIGDHDLNIANCKFIRTMIPSYYDFNFIYVNKVEDTKFKVHYSFYNYMRKKLAYKYHATVELQYKDKEYTVESRDNQTLSKQYEMPCNINVKTQKPAIYTNVLDNTYKTLYSLEKQFLNLFPLFTVSNDLQKFYYCK